MTLKPRSMPPKQVNKAYVQRRILYYYESVTINLFMEKEEGAVPKPINEVIKEQTYE